MFPSQESGLYTLKKFSAQEFGLFKMFPAQESGLYTLLKMFPAQEFGLYTLKNVPKPGIWTLHS